MKKGLVMQTISKIISTIRKTGTRSVGIATTLGVSEAMVSTWRNKDNDFVPRLYIASKIYKHYGYICYPYAEEALESYDI